MAWTAAGVDWFTGNADLPRGVRALFTYGAALAITALAIGEAVRVHRRYGVTLRSGAIPVRWPTESPSRASAPPR